MKKQTEEWEESIKIRSSDFPLFILSIALLSLFYSAMPNYLQISSSLSPLWSPTNGIRLWIRTIHPYSLDGIYDVPVL